MGQSAPEKFPGRTGKLEFIAFMRCVSEWLRPAAVYKRSALRVVQVRDGIQTRGEQIK